MQIFTLITSPINTNTYVIFNDVNRKAVVIDPGDDAPLIFEFLKKHDSICEAVLLTHAHFDHCNATIFLQERGAKIYAHNDELKLICSDDNLSKNFGITFNRFLPDCLLKDGDVIDVCDLSFKVIHSPGHTQGSVCYVVGNTIFTGDTLFNLGRGRTDFPTGNENELLKSISKLYSLKGDFDVYPGHGSKTTLEFERRYNYV